MADKNTLIEQMLEHLVNDEQQKAEELFHDYVVAKSREIYEGLIESDLSEEDKDEEEDEDEMEESFEEITSEEDKTDDLAGELDSEMGDMGDDMGGDDDMEEKSEEELFQDLDAIVDELQAKFDELKGEEGEEMGDDEEMKDDFELETVREYVEKVPAGHGAEKKGAAEKADNTKSAVAGKNDMGGTTANIAKAQEAKEASKGTAGGLAGNKPKEDNAGNINVPGGKAGSAFSTKESGHGAEKKGAAESADNKQSLFRGRR
jgi:hypothetical protein